MGNRVPTFRGNVVSYLAVDMSKKIEIENGDLETSKTDTLLHPTTIEYSATWQRKFKTKNKEKPL